MNDRSLFTPVRDNYLRAMEKRAEEEYIPIIKPEVGQFLKIMIKAKRPERILEIGTAIGYSTIWMAKAAGKGVEIVTIELDEDRAFEAEKHFHHYHFADRINLKIGDALEILPCLRRNFDLVFMDAAKGQYPNYLDYIMEILSVNAVVIADNVLYRGYVEKEGKIKHKRRTMVNNLRRYLEIIEDHPQLESMVLPIGDGLAVSVRRN